MKSFRKASLVAAVCCALGVAAVAQKAKPGYSTNNIEHGIMIRTAQIYLGPDNTSAKLSTIGRGGEVALLDQSGKWLHVLATVKEAQSENDSDTDITGWILNKGVVRPTTPNGDRILFGAAADSEMEASRSGGRRGAAGEAMRLYAKCAEFFPTSPVAGEAAYRAADIQWQLDRSDVMSRPSAKQRDPNDRMGMNEDRMKQVIKKFPGTKWADLAAYHLIENKLCGDWQGSTKCPEKESELYEKYVQEHPQSPTAAEALYEAAWRHGALIQLYQGENNDKKAGENQSKSRELAQRILSQFPQTDWASRAQTLLFMLDQQMPIYGNTVE